MSFKEYLKEKFENEYWKALVKFGLVWYYKKSKPSNNYIGGSQLLEPVYDKIIININDEIHNLVGGIFLVKTDGNVYELPRFAFDEKTPEYAPFEKSYGMRKDFEIPEKYSNAFKKLTKDQAKKIEHYRG